MLFVEHMKAGGIVYLDHGVIAEEKEENSKVANNPLAAVLGSVNAKKRLPPTLTFNADNEMVQTLLRIQGDNKLFQHVVHILYVQSLLQGKYPVNSEEMELFIMKI
jgi:molecular chaperone HtpG